MSKVVMPVGASFRNDTSSGRYTVITEVKPFSLAYDTIQCGRRVQMCVAEHTVATDITGAICLPETSVSILQIIWYHYSEGHDVNKDV